MKPQVNIKPRQLSPENSEAPRWSSYVSAFLAVSALLLGSTLALATLNLLETSDLTSRDAMLRAEIKFLMSKLEGIRMEKLESEADVAGNPKTDGNKREALAGRQTNLFEEILAAQRSVFEKFCHEKNATCPKGETGAKGQQGDTGLAGTLGQTGPLGAKGLMGEPGVDGPNGTQGDAGQNGKTGYPGNVGVMGDKGVQGAEGPNGTTGDVGVNGTTGVRGLQGAKGVQGSQGVAGSTGSKGPTGDRGDPGIQGVNGTLGLQGVKGNDTKKLPDGCQCVKQPTFRRTEDLILNLVTRETRDLLCEATGNPEPEVVITRLEDGKQVMDNRAILRTGSYQCLATNDFGTALKYVKVI